MASEWRTLPIKELYTGLYDGPHATPKPADSGAVFLGIKNVTDDGRLDLADIRYIAEDDYADWTRRVQPRENDLVFTYEATLNRYAIIPAGFRCCLGRRMALIRTNPQKVEVRFLLYYFFTDEWRAVIRRNMLTGATVDRIPLTTFPDFPVRVPPLPIQRRIAGILSAYDELIENSQRRIKILESMARALYREWFVHFRFPGHESVPRVPSPLGEIPQGWEVSSLGEFVQFKSGFAFKSGTFTAEGEHRLVTIKNVQDGSFSPESDSRMSELPANLPPYCVLKDGEILLSLTGNVGRVCLVYYGPFLLNQRVSKLVPLDDFDWAMTYCMFREPEMRVRLEQLSNGVAQQNLSPVLASKMEFVRPPRQLRQQFAGLSEPMVQRMVQLFSAIQTLRRTRDLLLPRLLSGQIDVEAIPS
jgi:type I restriction enzyme S subunit